MSLFDAPKRTCRAVFTAVIFTAACPVASHASTFLGEFWSLSSPNANINQAVAIVNGSTPDATFVSTRIDYPNGNTNIQASNLSLANFLGSDASSIVGDGTASVETSVFRFYGFLDLSSGIQNFALGSDDGYRLTIDGNVVSQRSRPRAFSTTALDADPATGRVPFELIFYENFGRTGVEFFIDSVLAVPAPIPLPGGLSLALTGLGAFGLIGWRRRAAKPKMPLANPA